MSSTPLPKLVRIICPHCRRPIDPLTLESAVSAAGAEAQYRICPECDEAIVLSVIGADTGDAAAEPLDAPAVANHAGCASEERLPA